MVAAFVVSYLYVPSFRQHVDLLRVNSLNVAEVSIAELEVVQTELHADEMQSEIEGGKLAVVRRRLRAMDKSAEKCIHTGNRLLHLLVIVCLLCGVHGGSGLLHSPRILLRFVIGLLSVVNQQLSHVVHDN